MARIIPYASLQFTAHEQYKMLLRTDSTKGWVDFFIFYILAHVHQPGILRFHCCHQWERKSGWNRWQGEDLWIWCNILRQKKIFKYKLFLVVFVFLAKWWTENHWMSVASTHLFSQNLRCSTKSVAFVEIFFILAHVGVLSHLVQIYNRWN